MDLANDELLAEALVHGGGSKRAVIEAALRTFVELQDCAATTLLRANRD
jgi:hypothetical protein